MTVQSLLASRLSPRQAPGVIAHEDGSWSTSNARGLPARDALTCVRHMLVAQMAGDLDAATRYLDRSVVLRPATRPGRSYYYGHAGFRQLVVQVQNTLGHHRLHWGGLMEVEPGTVVGTATVINLSGDEDIAVDQLRARFVVRYGQIVSYDGYPAS